jgi:hypothetical protein
MIKKWKQMKQKGARIFQTKLAVKIKTHILCPTAFFQSCTVYEIMWENIAEMDSPKIII